MANDEGQESGSKLRDQMVAWRNIAIGEAVKAYKYVKPSDLDGVEPEQIATKAQQVEAARKAEADELLREALVSRGVAVDSDLESALSKLSGGQQAEVQPSGTAARIASVGSLGGTPVKPKGPVPETAKGKILAGLVAEGN